MENNKHIKIDVQSGYLREHSSPKLKRYAFYYSINIANYSEQTVQLLSRHWIITDGNNGVEEVRGEGVIGEQPFIKPNNSFRYNSGAVLETPQGTMEGSYLMEDENDKQFQVVIPLFTLLQPNSLH